jgi:hypothetical protein
MKGKIFFARATLLVSVVLFGASAAFAAKDNVYGDVIAKAGQSEVVIDNTLPTGLIILVDGKEEKRVKSRSKDRFVVADGNHYLKVVGTSRGSASSRDFQFYTRGKRFFFKVTGDGVNMVSLNRENAYDLGIPAGAPAPGISAANGGVDVPLSETATGKDKAAMFDRLDRVAPAQPQAPAPAAAPAPARVAATPNVPAASSPAPSNAPVVRAGPKFATPDGRKPQIAVYVTGDRSDGEKKALGDKLLTALVNSGKFIAIERSKEFLTEIDNEQRRQREGSVDESQISKLGRQFGVHYVCVANIIEAFGGHQVSARIINVETAVVVAMGEDDSPLRNMDDLANVSFRIARALLKE